MNPEKAAPDEAKSNAQTAVSIKPDLGRLLAKYKARRALTANEYDDLLNTIMNTR